jgi:hypothetical protein
MNQQLIVAAATSLRKLSRFQCARVMTVAGAYSLDSRRDLGALQKVLGACHLLPGTVRCGCRAHEGVFLVLEVFLWQDGVFRIRRPAVSDAHHPLCIWRLPFSDQHPAEQHCLLPTGAILDALDHAPDFELWTTSESPRLERLRHASVTFSRVMSGVVRDATVLGWRGALWEAGQPITRPDALVIASAIDTCLNGQLCVGGSRLGELARAARVELIHGVALDASPWQARLRPDNSDTPVRLYCYERSGRTATLRGRWLLASGGVLDVASAPVRTLTGSVAPPYYFIGVVDGRGRLRRLTLFSIHFDRRDLVFVDSALERSCAADLLANHQAVLKPTDYMEIGHVADLDRRYSWMRTMPPYLPDFLVSTVAGENLAIELAGFDHRHVEYRNHLGRKIAAHRAAPRPYRLEVREGNRYRNAPPPANRWDDVRLPLSEER